MWAHISMRCDEVRSQSHAGSCLFSLCLSFFTNVLSFILSSSPFLYFMLSLTHTADSSSQSLAPKCKEPPRPQLSTLPTRLAEPLMYRVPHIWPHSLLRGRQSVPNGQMWGFRSLLKTAQ